MQAGGAASHIERSQQFLHIEEGYLPRVVVRRKRIFQSIGRTAMSATGVVKDDRELAQTAVTLQVR